MSPSTAYRRFPLAMDAPSSGMARIPPQAPREGQSRGSHFGAKAFRFGIAFDRYGKWIVDVAGAGCEADASLQRVCVALQTKRRIGRPIFEREYRWVLRDSLTAKPQGGTKGFAMSRRPERPMRTTDIGRTKHFRQQR